jgi:retron-type reverse transcriptase
MEAYGIGPHTQLIIKALCKHKLMVPKSGDCFGKQLHPIHGIWQGDVISPILFDIAIDPMLQEWDVQVNKAQLTGLSCFFYADDGWIDCDDNDKYRKPLT